VAALIRDQPQKYGFDAVDYNPPLVYDEVEVGGSLQLGSVAPLDASV
jgi:hypothetical protein